MTYLAPIVFVIVLWWFSTGAVLWLTRGDKRQVPIRLLLMTMMAAFGFAGAAISANSATWWAPYMGFTAAILVWGWAEFTFLTGLLTGPRQKPCPSDVSEWERFHLAFRTISRHEYTLVIAMLALVAITWTGFNHTAVCSFFVLWLMRISAKLTVFNGAPGFSVEMMPQKLNYMHSYFRADRIGPVFWVSILLSTGVLVATVASLMQGQVAPDNLQMTLMLTTLLGLAVFEHWMMILPIKDSTLWQWAMDKSGQTNVTKNTLEPTKIASAAE